MKRCADCGADKPLEEFVRNRSKKSGRSSYCKSCWTLRVRRHKQQLYGGEKNFLLKHRYGITTEEVERMYRQQEGRCAICRSKAADHVDHCHESGVVRGLLCFGCNRGLGKAQDDPELLRRGLSYLERHGWHGQLQLW